MFTLSDNFKTCFTECPDCAVRRDISEEHAIQKLLLRKLWHPLYLQQSSGGRS
jgi:hypothetical protein